MIHVRVGIIGTSWWADAMYLPALKNHPRARVESVAGRNLETTRKFASRWEIPRHYEDADELIEKAQIDAIIIATEAGMLHRLQKECPNKKFIPAPTEKCACNECHFMKMNTLEKVRNCMRNLSPQVELPAEIIERARLPIERMLEWTTS